MMWWVPRAPTTHSYDRIGSIFWLFFRRAVPAGPPAAFCSTRKPFRLPDPAIGINAAHRDRILDLSASRRGGSIWPRTMFIGPRDFSVRRVGHRPLTMRANRRRSSAPGVSAHLRWFRRFRAPFIRDRQDRARADCAARHRSDAEVRRTAANCWLAKRVEQGYQRAIRRGFQWGGATQGQGLTQVPR